MSENETDSSNQLTSEIVVLDIGAAAEGTPRWANLSNGKVIKIEPRDTGEENLVPVFLGDGKKKTFYHSYYGPCSSLFEPNDELIERLWAYSSTQEDGNFTVVKSEKVQTQKLDSLDLEQKVDFVKIDTQGSEKMIIKNGEKTIGDALVVEVEVEFEPLYKNQPLFGEVDAEMRRLGFVFHRFMDLSGRCIKPLGFQMDPGRSMSQILCADAVYVRPWYPDVKAYSDEDLLKTAIILGDCYNSFDLAARLFKEHDLRTGTNYFDRYASGIQAALDSGKDKWLTERH